MCLFVGSFVVYCINMYVTAAVHCIYMYVTAAVQCLPAQQKLLDVQARFVLPRDPSPASSVTAATKNVTTFTVLAGNGLDQANHHAEATYHLHFKYSQ